MSSITRFPGAVLLGAGLMYFLDPVRGRKRRARVGELATHARRVERDLVGKGLRDATHRAHGVTERLRHFAPEEVSDAVLQGRVRSHLGRVTTHAGSIEVDAHEGRVVLRGPILAGEAEEAIRCVRRVPGVTYVIDRLERHEQAGTIPGLQGERRRRAGAWTPAIRIGAIAAGTTTAAIGALAGGVLGKLAIGGGGVLALRGLVNRPLPAIVGRGEVAVQKTITVRAPVDEVYELWARFEEFPRFMEHVRQVEAQDGRARLTVDGPAGVPIAFDVEVRKHELEHVIEWHTLPDQPIEHGGKVRFDEVDGGTRVHIQMVYRPPGGVVTHTIAHLLGWDPKARMDDDMVRMKALLESGRTRAHHGRVAMSDLH